MRRRINHAHYVPLALVGGLLVATHPAALGAQQVPGRELFELPLGALAEAPALASVSGAPLWNPAAVGVHAGRFRAGAAALVTPADQGVSAQLLGAAVDLPAELTVAVSFARASVDDLVRTGSDPQSLGDLTYGSTLLSAMIAHRPNRHVATGLAVRYRSGQLDGESRGVVALDAGVMMDGLLGRDARLAASTFLWSPANQSGERTTFTGAADVRVAGHAATRELRAGYSYLGTEGATREHYAFASARYGVWEGRGGAARSSYFGESQWRLRLGLGVYYARYTVGIAREETGAGLPATYQFSLSVTAR